ncbi:MAG: class I SAM-dependent methyltransferase [Geminicoccaceae bacterium]
MSLNYSKSIGGDVEKFVSAALPYSHWGMAYFNIRLLELTLIDHLFDDVIARGGDSFLDVGCGLGLASVYASKTFRLVEGTDIDDLGVAFKVDVPAPVKGQAMMKELGFDSIRLHCGDTNKFLEEKEEAFDMILSVFVLEHVDNVESLLQLIARSLRPGGRVVHIVPNTHDTINQLLIQNLQPTKENERHRIKTGRGLKRMGHLYAPITHSEFIDDYREQFEINSLERYLFPIVSSGMKICKISPMREHSYAILAERPAV